ncbi:MAG: glycosyltransferase family 9 protein [bacterium]
MKNRQPKSILVISLPGIGDTINCTPVFKPLARAFPKAHVTTLVMYKPCKEVLENNPLIDEIILWEFLKEGALSSLRFLLKLRRRRFDLSIMCYPANRAEYNAVGFIIGARLRLAHRYRHDNAMNLFFLNNRTVMERKDLHNVEENLRLLDLAGVDIMKEDRSLALFLEEKDRAYASQFIGRLPDHDILIGMHAWSTTLKNMHRKCWPAENFAALANRLSEDRNCQVLLFQGPHDVETNRRIIEACKAHLHLVEKTTVRQSAAIMARCNLFITNDAGPMHMAASVGTPVVAIFGPTEPAWLHPWTEEYTVVRTGIDCSPCFYYSPKPLTCKRGDYACLSGLSVDTVYRAAKEMLRKVSFQRERDIQNFVGSL